MLSVTNRFAFHPEKYLRRAQPTTHRGLTHSPRVSLLSLRTVCVASVTPLLGQKTTVPEVRVTGRGRDGSGSRAHLAGAGIDVLLLDIVHQMARSPPYAFRRMVARTRRSRPTLVVFSPRDA